MRDAAVQLCLLHEDLGLLRTVRVFGMENIDKQRFDEHLERFREADVRRIKTEGRLNPTTGLLYGVATVAGDRPARLQRAGRRSGSRRPRRWCWRRRWSGLVHPIAGVARRCAGPIRQANRSARAIFEFLERQARAAAARRGASSCRRSATGSRFENVTLESRSGRTLLDGVSAEIPAGSRTAIMSLDEDAKLALVCLIPRLIDPKVGRVRIDGQDLRDVTLESIRAQVATVLQADLVFTDSVAMNIGLGDPSYRAAPDHRGRQGRPRPQLHPGPAPRLRHDHRPARPLPQARRAVPDRAWPAPTCTTPRS